MPKKENLKLINTKDVTRVIVGVIFEVDAQGNLEGAMTIVDGILNSIANKAEVADDAIDIKLEINANGVI